MQSDLVATSKFLSYVLRHHPAAIGITLDKQGWINVDKLLLAIQQSGRNISLELLQEVVFTNDKQRFAFSADGQKIRANQGHSIDIDLALESQLPPQILYHGTAQRFLEAIQAEGLKKMQRHHVHLSPTLAIAEAVGQRHGKVVVLGITARTMHMKGHEFFLSNNGVWLTDHVPPEFMSIVQ
ncbi:RNA 2'-phosphotransferase [[Leptolyngbya] sp. PCC 7376]|nr:RNA 2'-phosphotransferase [[Leptolyngbya] sp. PCC 7376]